MDLSPVAITKTSDIAPISSKEFLDFQATIGFGSTLKRVCENIQSRFLCFYKQFIYSQNKNLYLSKSSLEKNHRSFGTYINNNYRNVISKVTKVDIEFNTEQITNYRAERQKTGFKTLKAIKTGQSLGGLKDDFSNSCKFFLSKTELALNPLTTSVPHHIQASQYICSIDQLTGFSMMKNNDL